MPPFYTPKFPKKIFRRPIFYITVIVVPIFLISTLSILGIFTPGSSDGPRGEKVSLGLGSLLAMTVLLGIVAGAMPKSNSIPLLGVYILVVILLCAISVAISMAFMASSKRYVEGARIPSQLTYKLSLVRPRIKRTKDLKRINMEEEGEGLLLNRGKSLREQLFIGGIRFTEPYMEEEGGEGGDCEENKNNYGSFGETKERSNNKNGVLGNNNRRLSPKLEDNFNGDNKKRRATTTNIDISNIPLFFEHLTIELSTIRTMLGFVVETQRGFRKRLERDKTREKIESEWARIFVKLDYACLIIFQFLNLISLLVFLKFAWTDSPKEPERQLV
uniref:Neurotransmitter-gated ion-channel transmembrane domain-containing protein n=1 Tax=Meloidogyne incognita TaxID=6306 RepID=A0A914MUA0_MELIC